MTKKNKPIIETAINGAALILIATGVPVIQANNPWGYLQVAFGVALEFFKYWGRDKYW